MRCCIVGVVLLLPTGCVVAARVTVGPTVDTFGNVGGEVKLTVGGGLRNVLLEPTVGVSNLARENTMAVTVRPELTYWFEPTLAGSQRRMPAFRAAFFYSGHLFWIDGREQRLDGIGLNFAILPRLYFGEPREAHGADIRHFVHLGAEFSGECGWGSPGVANRGIFSLGLTTDFSWYGWD